MAPKPSNPFTPLADLGYTPMARFDLSQLPRQNKEPYDDPADEINLSDDEEYAEANPVIEEQLPKAEAKAFEHGEALEVPRKGDVVSEVPQFSSPTGPHFTPMARFDLSLLPRENKEPIEDPEFAIELSDDEEDHTEVGGEDPAHFGQTRKEDKLAASLYIRYYNDHGQCVNAQFVDNLDSDTPAHKRFLKATMNDDTQCPSVSIFIEREGQSVVEARIFGSNLIKDEDRKTTEGQQLPPAFEFNVGPQIDHNYIKPGSAIVESAQAEQLHQTILRVRRDGKSIVWNDITESDIKNIRDKREPPNGSVDSPLLQWEDAVWHISHAHEFAIHNFPGSDSSEKGSPTKTDDTPAFQKYFSALMETARKHGDL